MNDVSNGHVATATTAESDTAHVLKAVERVSDAAQKLRGDLVYHSAHPEKAHKWGTIRGTIGFLADAAKKYKDSPTPDALADISKKCEEAKTAKKLFLATDIDHKIDQHSVTNLAIEPEVIYASRAFQLLETAILAFERTYNSSGKTSFVQAISNSNGVSRNGVDSSKSVSGVGI